MKSFSKDFRYLTLCLVLAIAVTACNKKKDSAGGEAPKGPPVATVDGVEIPLSDFEAALRRMPPTARQNLQDPEKRREFLDDFLGDKLLYIEAQRRGLDKDPDTVQRVREYQERVVVQALRRDMQRQQVDEAAIEKYYQDHVDDFTSERGRFSMILKRRPPGRTPEQEKQIEDNIRSIYRKLKQGSDFAKLAKTESEDPRSSQDGGDLGFSNLARWSSRVEEEGNKLKVGEISEPFQVGYGWIVLKRTEASKKVTEPLIDAKPRIAQILRQNNMDAFKDELRKSAKISVNESALNSLDTANAMPMHGGMMGTPSAQESAPAAEKQAPAEEQAPAEGH